MRINDTIKLFLFNAVLFMLALSMSVVNGQQSDTTSDTEKDSIHLGKIPVKIARYTKGFYTGDTIFEYERPKKEIKPH